MPTRNSDNILYQLKSIISITFIVIVNSINAQFSVSGGYIRRTEGERINLPSHFGMKPSSANNLYNSLYVQTTYQSKPREEVVAKIGFFFGKEADYYAREEYTWGSPTSGVYHVEQTYTSIINYSAMNVGFGVNKLLFNPKKTGDKFKSITTIGFLLQAEVLLNYRERNHLSEYYKSTSIYIGPDPTITSEESSSSDTTFQSLLKRRLFLDLGVSFSERIIFKSTYFLEFKVNFSLAGTQRFSTSRIAEGSDNTVTSNFPLDGSIFQPILETGIGVGYIFPVKKKKT